MNGAFKQAAHANIPFVRDPVPSVSLTSEGHCPLQAVGGDGVQGDVAAALPLCVVAQKPCEATQEHSEWTGPPSYNNNKVVLRLPLIEM